MEGLELILCLDSCGNVHEGVFKTFGEVFLEFFVKMGIAMGQLSIHGFLLVISPIFNFLSIDVANA